ncbi:GNAT family N-acetyltransferase [bacterium SCSIO 12741]|nr:GNAT family N-acetyltransferase [bacterium SCSIO 12741]
MDHYLETERLILRPFDQEDIEPSYQMNLDAEVSRYTGDGGVVSREEVAHRIQENVLGDYRKHGFGRFAVELKGGPRFIGFAGLKYLPDWKEVDLGYRFMQDYWGQGLATEAGRACLKFGFETLHLSKIIAMALPENEGSVRVLQKLNFQFEKEILEEGDLVHVFQLFNPDSTDSQ